MYKGEHEQRRLRLIRCQADRMPARRTDLELQREYEYWLRTLTDDEHQAALARYRQLQHRFPDQQMRQAYIVAATIVRRDNVSVPTLSDQLQTGSNPSPIASGFVPVFSTSSAIGSWWD